jgi:hypothetical protein
MPKRVGSLKKMILAPAATFDRAVTAIGSGTTRAFLGTNPENRDSDPAGLGAVVSLVPRRGTLGQPSFVIRSALWDLDRPIADVVSCHTIEG